MYMGLYPNELKRGAELDMPECIATNVIHLRRAWVEQQDKPQLTIGHNICHEVIIEFVMCHCDE